MNNNHGAAPGDWAHWSFVLGLTSDLLPVVSNPSAIISETSKLQGIGKTPSTYIGTSSARRVVGILGWTAKQTIDEEIEQWSEDTDLGICLQTREVRAIDVDVTDPAEAQAINDVIVSMLGDLPKRYRYNSSKFAVAIRLPGELPKRKLVTAHGIIEFLATGQQFIVSGTHPSGVRYEWRGGLPVSIINVSIEQFNALWQALEHQFATEDSADSREFSKRKSGDSFETDDIVRDFLIATKRVISTDRDGALIIECPWNDQHTSGSVGDSSTVWFPAGSKGYERGHFRCLHGHCEHQTDDAFIDTLDMPSMQVIDMFEVVPQRFVLAADGSPTGEVVLDSPNYSRTLRLEIRATLDNIRMALMRVDVCNMDIAYDNFKDEISIRIKGDEWRNFTDEDNTALRLVLEQGGFLPVGADLVRDVVRLVAKQKQFDSAIDWAEKLVWDGVPRVEMFNHTHLGAEDTPYTRAVSMYTWTGMAGRCLVPGIKADICPIWETPTQGENKSSAIKMMVPKPEMFSEMTLHETEENIARKMRGKLLGELAEMDGLKARDSESTKKMVSSVGANIVPKYKEHAVLVLRRFIMIGTTNDNEILFDISGNRRWAPFRIKRANLERIEMDRTQLWAEAVVIFKKLGVCYQGVEQFMKPEHEKFRAIDSWESDISDWLNLNNSIDGEYPRNFENLTTSRILQRALHFSPDRIKRADEMRAGKVMKLLGFENKQLTIGGNRKHVWRKV